MITLTCREIIRAAKFIAGVRNSNISNFEFTTSILNNIYRELYQKVIDNSDAYISIINGTATPDGIALPEDCYQVEAVYIGSDWEHKVEIHRSARNQDIDGCWRVINNRLYIDGNINKPVIIKYSTLPPTLTAPEDPIKLNLSLEPNYETALDEKYFYYINRDENRDPVFKTYKYNLDTGEETEITLGEFPSNQYDSFMFESKDYSVDYENQVISDENGEDVTSLFISRTDAKFIIVRASGSHWVVSYEDGIILIDGAEWNILADTGHDTRGFAITLYTNDRTGKGLIWNPGLSTDVIGSSNVYYCSFVPDTVISYPDNSFFQLLEYKLAQFLAGQVGTANATLEDTLLPNAEKQFYESLSKNGNIVRTNNVYRKY